MVLEDKYWNTVNNSYLDTKLGKIALRSCSNSTTLIKEFLKNFKANQSSL